jgi:hypothetical protein
MGNAFAELAHRAALPRAWGRASSSAKAMILAMGLPRQKQEQGAPSRIRPPRCTSREFCSASRSETPRIAAAAAVAAVVLAWYFRALL